MKAELNIYHSIMNTEIQYIDDLLLEGKITPEQHSIYADRIIKKRDERTREAIIRHSQCINKLLTYEK